MTPRPPKVKSKINFMLERPLIEKFLDDALAKFEAEGVDVLSFRVEVDAATGELVALVLDGEGQEIVLETTNIASWHEFFVFDYNGEEVMRLRGEDGKGTNLKGVSYEVLRDHFLNFVARVVHSKSEAILKTFGGEKLEVVVYDYGNGPEIRMELPGDLGQLEP